jgi:hypothetical protein
VRCAGAGEGAKVVSRLALEKIRKMQEEEGQQRRVHENRLFSVETEQQEMQVGGCGWVGDCEWVMNRRW